MVFCFVLFWAKILLCSFSWHPALSNSFSLGLSSASISKLEHPSPVCFFGRVLLLNSQQSSCFSLQSTRLYKTCFNRKTFVYSCSAFLKQQKSYKSKARETTQWTGALAALPENPGLILEPTWQLTAMYNSSSICRLLASQHGPQTYM